MLEPVHQGESLFGMCDGVKVLEFHRFRSLVSERVLVITDCVGSLVLEIGNN